MTSLERLKQHWEVTIEFHKKQACGSSAPFKAFHEGVISGLERACDDLQREIDVRECEEKERDNE